MSTRRYTEDPTLKIIGGYGARMWHRAEIKDALRHLGRRPRYNTRKPQLWEALCSAVEDDALSASACDRLALTYRVHGKARLERILQARNRRSGTVAAAQQSFDDDTGSSGATTNNSTEQDFDCTICAETLGVDHRPERPESSVCAHENNICRQCLAQSVSTQLSYKPWDALSCPSCDSRYGYDEIKAYADPAVFARYDAYLLQRSLSGAQFQPCRTAGCESGQMCFPDQDHYIICQDCHGRTCITCDIPWHPDVSCKQVAEQRAKARSKEEKASDKYIATKTKRCPRCNRPGYKVSGCDHMTCPRCSHQYCWVCLADYQPIRANGNRHHHETCAHHANNLPNLPNHPLAAFR